MSFGRTVQRDQGTATSAVLVILGLLVYGLISPRGLSAYTISTLSDQTAVLAIAAVGTTFVVAAGGFDLSIGALVSLANVIVAAHMQDSLASEIGISLLVCAVGGLAGALNGFLVAVIRLPSVVATLATSFVWTGVALLVLPSPGGEVPQQFVSALTAQILGYVPMSLVLIIGSAALWLLLRRTRFGIAVFATGDDESAAAANAINVTWTVVGAYLVAGVLYSIAGLFLSAQTASGDPNLGAPLMLTVYTAIVVGTRSLQGGRGSAIGSILGAFMLRLIGNLLFLFGVSSYFTSIVTGLVLLGALALGLVDVRRILRSRPGGAAPRRWADPES